MRRLIAIAIAALVFGALSGVAAYQKVRPQGADDVDRHWQEIAWPYPRDGWPAGRAFRCDGCTEPIEIYVRPKIGFCNCDTGVADDDEVDRVADLDLISDRFAPLAPGQVIRVADLRGRVRAYDLDMPGGARHAAIGIAVSHRCDLLVAVAQGRAHADELQREAVAFLTTERMKHWTMAALGGG
ncbi:hypothetical protein [Bradyrhizobium sp. Tv2a-2]|uniref:hypothetical protein n=1 Tax=Bradyrhizobium sp. Tv2a-2 TaxID=113395 RepID=UPI00041DA382|nr:hypothetical protein [Bradyrhizobium sp. Tv2a-2]